MSRLNVIKIDSASGKQKIMLENAKKTLGAEINLIGAFANSPASLEGYLSLNRSLSSGVLASNLRETLAVATAGYNRCNYCASAHTFIGKKAGITEEELHGNLSGKSQDPDTQVVLDFVYKLIDNKGHIEAEDLNKVKDAGFSDEEIIEMIAHVAMNTFTNYFNSAFQIEIDFPIVNI